ncbi:beta strand repeat-containing protein [Collimonas pratensis]|uniref:Uncharacterized protein n=1 Tax=Collimonas pratensis TaxID=279113 RepID=A0ABM5Z2V0_9BURK|nr:hypothetical protein [Collimonas pratensis]AMP13279.1 hypothetical protein CPter291_1001 [Collimonas pratensis]
MTTSSVAINANLQNRLDAFAASAAIQQLGGTTSVAYQDILSALQNSSTLTTELNAAANSTFPGTFSAFGILDATSHSGAAFQNGVLELKVSAIGSTLSEGDLVFQMGHEAQHGLNAADMQTSKTDFMNDVTALAASSAPQDYTTLLQTRQTQEANNESTAQIAGWNAYVNYVDTTTQAGSTPNYKTSYLSAYFFDANGNLNPNLTFNDDHTVTATPANIAAERNAFFYNSAASLGANGNESYPAYYAGDNVAYIANTLAQAGKSGFTLDLASMHIDPVQLQQDLVNNAKNTTPITFTDSSTNAVLTYALGGTGNLDVKMPFIGVNGTGTTETIYNRTGKLTTNINTENNDATGIVTTTVDNYSSTGLPTSQSITEADVVTGAVKATTTNSYDNSGNLATQVQTTIDPAAGTTTTSTVNYNLGVAGGLCTFDTTVSQVGFPGIDTSEVSGTETSAGVITTANISGTGAIVNATGASVSLANSTSAAIIGNANTITGNGSGTINVGSNSNNNVISGMVGGAISIADGDHGEVVNATSATVTLGNGASANVNGTVITDVASATPSSLGIKLDDNGNISQTDATATDANGVQSEDLKNLNTDGSVQNEDIITTPTEGQATAIYTGEGGVIDLSNSAITLGAHSSGTLTGSGNAVTEDSGATANIDAQSINDIITMATNSSVVVDDGASCTLVNAVSDTVTLDSGASATVNGSVETNAAGATPSTLTLTLNSSGTVSQTEALSTDVNGVKDDDLKLMNSDGSLQEELNTITNVDGSKTETLTAPEPWISASTVGRDTIITSADGLTISVTADTDGDGITDWTQLTTTDSTGVKTEANKYINTDGTLYGEDLTITNPDGSSFYEDKIFLGIGVNNSLYVDSTTTTYADGSSVQDEKSFDTEGQVTGYDTIAKDVDGNTIEDSQSPPYGDGSVQISHIVTGVDGTIVRNIKDMNADGSLQSEWNSITQADGSRMGENIFMNVTSGWADEHFSYQADGSGFDEMVNYFSDGGTSDITLTTNSSGETTETIPIQRDQIILNLSGNKVGTVGLPSSTAYFDMNNNGQQVQTGWATAGEGVLVYDPNNTGTVTSSANLVAGFAALSAMAHNVGSVLDASNSIWSGLKVWVDLTGDANAKQATLYSLDQLGITSINLSSTIVNDSSSGNGNMILNDSTFTWKNGIKGDIAGVDLAYNPNVVASPSAQAATQASATPLTTSGSMHSLVQSMAAFTDGSTGVDAQSPLANVSLASMQLAATPNSQHA